MIAGSMRCWAEEQPFEVDAAVRVADRNVQTRMGEFVGEIGADGGGLGDHRVAVLQRRHLSHRIDGEVIGFICSPSASLSKWRS